MADWLRRINTMPVTSAIDARTQLQKLKRNYLDLCKLRPYMSEHDWQLREVAEWDQLWTAHIHVQEICHDAD